MALRKVGSPHKIEKVIKSEAALSLDPNIVVKEIEKAWGDRTMTIDELHEALKSMGIVDYEDEDLRLVIKLLKSVGFTVTQ